MPKFNKDNGKHDKEVQSKTKAANAPRGKFKQPKGSAKHNTKPKNAKPMKNQTNSGMEDMEF